MLDHEYNEALADQPIVQYTLEEMEINEIVYHDCLVAYEIESLDKYEEFTDINKMVEMIKAVASEVRPYGRVEFNAWSWLHNEDMARHWYESSAYVLGGTAYYTFNLAMRSYHRFYDYDLLYSGTREDYALLQALFPPCENDAYLLAEIVPMLQTFERVRLIDEVLADLEEN